MNLDSDSEERRTSSEHTKAGCFYDAYGAEVLGELPRRRFGAFALVAGSLVVLGVIGGVIADSTLGLASRFLLGLAPLHVAGVALGVMMRTAGLPIRSWPRVLGFVYPARVFSVWRGALAAVGVYVLCAVITVCSTVLLDHLGIDAAGSPLLRLLRQDPRPPLFSLVAVAAVVFVPPVEEIAFRVLIYDALETFVNSGWAAVAASGLFAVLHGAPEQVPALFCLGLLLQHLRRRYASLWPCVLTHSVFNACGVGALWLVLHSGVDV